MIIGSGSIAKMLNDRKDVLFFASGFSDSSQHPTMEQRKREANLIGEGFGYASAHEMMFVYFSTISIFTNDTPYTKHKFEMESIIKIIGVIGWPYTIIRIGNIWECTNPHTFINAYKTNPYEPRDEWKYMISKEQLLFITDNLPTTGKHEISIFGTMEKVKDCI